MSAVKVARTDNIKLICKGADSAVHGYLNGEEVYQKQAVGQTNFTDERRITEILRDGHNSLVVLGVRWGNGYFYDVVVELNGNIIASRVERDPPPVNNPFGIVWDFAVELDMAST